MFPSVATSKMFSSRFTADNSDAVTEDQQPIISNERLNPDSSVLYPVQDLTI